MFTAFELFLSDEVQSLIDHFAAVLDLRVTFFSADGRELRRGRPRGISINTGRLPALFDHAVGDLGSGA